MAGGRRVHVILTTVGSEEEGRALARTWVTRRRAACVSVLPRAWSTYRWQGEVVEAAESILWIKTAFADEVERDRLLADLAADHPYDEPEFLVLDPSGGSAGYLAWVLDQVGP